MKTPDKSQREELDAEVYTTYTNRKSKIVPSETLVETVLKITCPSCKKKHWYGTGKRHYCKQCNIWVMADFTGYGGRRVLYVSLTKEGLGMTRWETDKYKLKQERRKEKRNEKS